MDHRTSGTFSCRKTDMLCLKDRKQHKKGLLSSWKVQKHSSGDRSKGKASSQRDPQAQHSSYLSSAALCAKVLALVQHTRRCHCGPREPYVSNLSANPCSERPRWCSASDARCILMSNLFLFHNKVLRRSEIARKNAQTKQNATQIALFVLLYIGLLSIQGQGF